MFRSLVRALTAAALALALVGSSGVATADNAKGKAKKSTSLKKSAALKKNSADCAKARKRGKACKIEFKTGDTLEGGVASGTGDNIVAPGVVTHSSLIRLRLSFRDRIIRTGENL